MKKLILIFALSPLAGFSAELAKKGDIFDAILMPHKNIQHHMLKAVPVDLVKGKAKIHDSSCFFGEYKIQQKEMTAETKSYVFGEPIRVLYIGAMKDGRILVEYLKPTKELSYGVDPKRSTCSYNKKHIISAELFDAIIKANKKNQVTNTKKQNDEEEITNLVSSAK